MDEMTKEDNQREETSKGGESSSQHSPNLDVTSSTSCDEAIDTTQFPSSTSDSVTTAAECEENKITKASSSEEDSQCVPPGDTTDKAIEAGEAVSTTEVDNSAIELTVQAGDRMNNGDKKSDEMIDVELDMMNGEDVNESETSCIPTKESPLNKNNNTDEENAMNDYRVGDYGASLDIQSGPQTADSIETIITTTDILEVSAADTSVTEVDSAKYMNTLSGSYTADSLDTSFDDDEMDRIKNAFLLREKNGSSSYSDNSSLEDSLDKIDVQGMDDSINETALFEQLSEPFSSPGDQADSTDVGLIDKNNNMLADSNAYDDSNQEVSSLTSLGCLIRQASDQEVSTSCGMAACDSNTGTDGEISPEMFCIPNLSPTEMMYGPDLLPWHRQRVPPPYQLSRPESTLNTPDPIIFEDSDSNSSLHGAFMNSTKSFAENPVPSFTDEISKGEKRKHENEDLSNNNKCMNTPKVSSMHQGPPPDISTWTAMSSKFGNEDNHFLGNVPLDQWNMNKPTCTVPPYFQNYSQAKVGNYPVTGNTIGTGDQLPTRVEAYRYNGTQGTYQCMNQSNGYPGPPYYSERIPTFVSDQSHLPYDIRRPQPMFNNNYARNTANANVSMGVSYTGQFPSPYFGQYPYTAYTGNQATISQVPYVSINYSNNVIGSGLTSSIYYGGQQMHRNFAVSSLDNQTGLNFSNRHIGVGQGFHPYVNQSTINSDGLPQTKTSYIQPNMLNQTVHAVNNRPTSTETVSDGGQDLTDEVICETDDEEDSFESGKSEPNIPVVVEKNDNVKEQLLIQIPQHTYNEPVIDLTKDSQKNVASASDFQHASTRSKVMTSGENHTERLKDDSCSSAEARRTGSTEPAAVQCQSLVKDSNVEDVSADECPDSPEDSELKIENPYFHEQYRKKIRSNSPITAFCKALKSTEKVKNQAAVRQNRPVQPLIKPMIAQPMLPVAGVMNQNLPNLSYRGHMLVPYINSIFAAAAKADALARAQKHGLVATTEHQQVKQQQQQQYVQQQQQQSLQQQLTLQQQEQQQQLQSSGPTSGACIPPVQPNTCLVTSSVTMPTASQLGPLINVNSTPLPLYGQTLRFPVQPLVPIGGQATNSFTMNIGVNGPDATLPSPSLSSQNKRANQRPVLPRGMAAPTGLHFTAKGSNITSPVPISANHITTYLPFPERPSTPQLPAVKGKTAFKAKHFTFWVLEIGSYKHCCNINSNMIARVKFLYSQKKLVYEYELHRTDNKLCRQMVEVVIPFSTISNIWLYLREMRLELSTAPRMFMGLKDEAKTRKMGYHSAAVYNRKKCIDLSNGQIATSKYHYVEFRTSCAGKIKAELQLFSDRFAELLKQPFIVDSSQSLKQGATPISSYLLDPSIKLPVEPDVNNNNPAVSPSPEVQVSGYIQCACKSGCSSSTCHCCVKGLTCTQDVCLCLNCRNPLNILHQLGLPAHRARTDPCLMENIYQIPRLDCYVKTQLVLECCLIPVLLFNCIPGEITCPNTNCSNRYKYSWCNATLCNEKVTPRNHCVKCGRCTDYRNVHCKNCNVCYFAGESRTFKCSRCHSCSIVDNTSSDLELEKP